MVSTRTALSRLVTAAVLLVLCCGLAISQSTVKKAAPAGAASLRALKTRPERTTYAETSRYQDVIDFLNALAAASPRIHLTTYGYTFEGRALPLAVIGAKDASPEAVKATGKVRIYVEGNIHAGEVEGKEAMLEMLRSIALGEHDAWLSSVVLLINPIFNADGNERVNLNNRPSQNGPIGGMGQRHNAQDYDLNRDFMKLDAPETRSFEMMMSSYDPHIVVDLHTTDGSAHAYQLTYAPPLHPATSASVVDELRKGLLPAVTKAIKSKDNMDYYYYVGGVRGVPGASFGGGGGMGGPPGGGRGTPPAGGRGTPPAGRGEARGGREPLTTEPYFSTTEPTARYGINMVGLRNRLGILSETYSYLTFKDRILAARRFVEEICNYAQSHGAEIIKATSDADHQSIVGQEVALRGKPVKSEEQVDFLMGEVTYEKNPYTGGWMRRRLDVSKPVRLSQFISFEASETTVAPRFYFVPPQPVPGGAPPAAPTLRYAQDRLEAHGIRFTKLEQAMTIKGEQFRLESSTLAAQPYEGHNARTMTGKWEPTDLNIPAGTLVVPVDQPLGRLALMLLEPRSEDSLGYWGLLDDVLERQKPQFYPITRTSEAIPGVK